MSIQRDGLTRWRRQQHAAERMCEAAARAVGYGRGRGYVAKRLVSRTEAIQRASRAAYLRALKDVRGYLAQDDDLKVYVADVTDELDRLAKEASR